MPSPYDLSALISAIYDAAYEPAEWPKTLECIRIALNGSHACISRQGPNMTAGDNIRTQTDQDFTRRYLEDERFRNDRMWLAFLRRPSGPPLALHELCGADHLHRSPFFNEWLLPQDIVSSTLVKVMVAGNSHWLFDISRGRGQSEFGERDLATIGALAPHLSRASGIGRMTALRSMAGPWRAGAAMGVASVDADLRIADTDAAAEAILSRAGCPLGRGGGRLRLHGHAGDKLIRFVRSACAGNSLSVPCGGEMLVSQTSAGDGERIDLALSVGPGPRGFLVEPLATVLMREMTPVLPARFASTAAAIFGLTAKEARLATLLAEGRTLREAATSQRVAVSTARTHLEHIFRKTETRQQSELVARLRLLEVFAR